MQNFFFMQIFQHCKSKGLLYLHFNRAVNVESSSCEEGLLQFFLIRRMPINHFQTCNSARKGQRSKVASTNYVVRNLLLHLTDRLESSMTCHPSKLTFQQPSLPPFFPTVTQHQKMTALFLSHSYSNTFRQRFSPYCTITY